MKNFQGCAPGTSLGREEQGTKRGKAYEHGCDRAPAAPAPTGKETTGVGARYARREPGSLRANFPCDLRGGNADAAPCPLRLALWVARRTAVPCGHLVDSGSEL